MALPDLLPRFDPSQNSALCTLLGTEYDPHFEEFAILAAMICQTPMSAAILVDAESQHIKGAVGFHCFQLPLAQSFCEHVLQRGHLLEVSDASVDPRFLENPFVSGTANVRFYAGIPLVTPGGEMVGALCVVDTVQRKLKPWQMDGFNILARMVNARIAALMREALTGVAAGT